MRFEELSCIVAVAETGSITAAAKKVFISQQAVSANIKKLEDELQCNLLVREKDGVSLTEKGKETVAFARRILAEKESFYNHISMAEQAKPVLVRVCSTSSVTNIVLPDVLDYMESKKQKVTLKIKMEDDLDDLFERVNTGYSDIGLLTFNEEELIGRFTEYQEDMEMDILESDHIVAVLNKKFVEEGALELSRERFFQHRQSLYNLIPSQKYLASTAKSTMVFSNDAEFHRAMLERSNTLVMMPSLAYQYFFTQKKYVATHVKDVELPPLLHAAVYRKDAPKHIQEFVKFIRLAMHMK